MGDFILCFFIINLFICTFQLEPTQIKAELFDVVQNIAMTNTINFT